MGAQRTQKRTARQPTASYCLLGVSTDSAGIAAGYRMDGQRSIPGTGKWFFSTQRPDRFWGPPSLQPHKYRRFSPWKWSNRRMKLTIYLHLLPKLGIVELYLHSPMRLHTIMLTEDQKQLYLQWYVIHWVGNLNQLHGAEPFLRNRQLCSYSRTSQQFMEPEGSIQCSQESFIFPYPELERSNREQPTRSSTPAWGLGVELCKKSSMCSVTSPARRFGFPNHVDNRIL
jgi:hypothetical protein